jgi:anti-sigma factor RsiW
MRCSSCKLLLARYWERTLDSRQAARVEAHLRTCARCNKLLDEIKVVDALLVTTNAPELPADFTAAVMHATKAPRPQRGRGLLWASIVAYVVLAWMVIFVWFAFQAHTGTLTRIALAVPVAASIVIAILCVDVLLAIGAIALYRRRRAKSLAAMERS